MHAVYLKNIYFTGIKDTECAPVDEEHLQCKFPENIRITRKDFAVYFLPETGGEGNTCIIEIIIQIIYLVLAVSFSMLFL